jgi:hypothetical protein
MLQTLYQPRNFFSSWFQAKSLKKTVSESKALTGTINIFLTVDPQIIDQHFNPNDPSPIYKRQLSHQFEQYIASSIATVKRYSIIKYKINCKNESDKQYVEPFMYAIKRHFLAKKALKMAEFEKFKKRSYMLLFLSLAVVMICRGVVPLILDENHHLEGGLSNSLDIFSWVLLWQPIDSLLFHYNPYLKNICVMDKLATAEVIIN